MNILVNSYCNLRCPYCFADPKMEECGPQNMTVENFRLALNFLKRSGFRDVRLIGGEPTLFPKIKEFIDIVISYKCFDSILIFSNFTFGEEMKEFFLDRAKKIKLSFLPNVNEFDLILPKYKERILDNLDAFINDENIKQNCIGVNVYRPDLDLTQWEEIIKKYQGKLEYLRYCIAVPSQKILNNEFDYFKYYSEMEPIMWRLYDISQKYNIRINCDCNNVPPCCFSDKLIATLFKGNFEMLSSAGSNPYVCGYPVIDCAPDLSLTGCFGYDDLKIKGKALYDFRNLQEIVNYYAENLHDDKLARKECLNCPRYKFSKRSCSCISMHRINKEDVSQSPTN